MFTQVVSTGLQCAGGTDTVGEGQRSVTAEVVTPPQDGYGFSVGAPMTYMSNIDADRELDAVAKTNATWLRVLVDWHLVEPMPGASTGVTSITGSTARGTAASTCSV